MAAAEPSVEIPDYSDIISDVVNRENIKNFTYVVTPPSAKGENFLSLIYRIKVNGVKDDNEKTELNLILKQPLNSKIFREKFPLHTLYSREAYIYNVILPELCALQDKYDVPEEYKFKHVKCYRADSEEFQEILVFEDMGDKNFTMVNRRVSLGYKHLKLILKNMASFHALSYVLKKFNPGKFEEFTKHTGGIMDHPKDQIQYFDIALERTINAMEDLSFIEKLKAFGVNFYDKLEYYLNPCTVAPGAVLCHGDSWNNNLLFRMEEGEPVDMVLLDWQLARYCSPVTDIAYLFFSSTDYDVRHEHFDDLMDFYHESLTKSLSLMQCNIEDHFPKAVFKRHLKEILPYGLLISFMLLPIVLGEEEDVPDFDELLKKEDHDLDDWKITNEDASSRFESRIRGNVKSFIEMDLI